MPSPIRERKTLIVGISGKARHGKDTVAEHIIKVFGNKIKISSIGFADNLKVEVFDFLQAQRMLRDSGLVTPHPLSDANTRFVLPSPYVLVSTMGGKLTWINAHKNQLRGLLQWWGTEYRRFLNENYWIEKTQKQIEEERPQVAILRDLRFANEASICDVTICVERLGYREADENVGKHVSETELTSIPFDYRIAVPDGQLGLLKSEAEVVFQQIIDKFL